MDLLDNCQSDVTMENSGECFSTVDSRAGLNGLDAITPFGSSHDRCFVPQPTTGSPQGLLPHSARSSADYVAQPQHSIYSAGFPAFCDPRVTRSSSEPEGMDARFDLLLRGTSKPVYEPSAQTFQGIYFGEHVPSSSSAGPDAQLSVSVVQANQAKDKVECTWDGCSAVISKDSLTRHVEEVHEGKIKAVCTGCGREFKRQYQMNEHIPRCRRS
ncbi:uncharacterized protein HD556DRAFT_1439677 [Suillus plorans]|uniref:C2H2-type domain-containing protein n=1 Tax=Suillus plorans TaxID=116603 RepID=A0A9P7DNI8_9AGAM|nr:uncharacterized protein HD556DRAFT_1439677 [Suillus plorans]KAG1799271.1 hypothetical protein HD556DRAFT_1439677 [Suillus plorans]